MQSDRDVSLSDEATFAGRPRPQRVDVSIGDERTLGDVLASQETIIDDIKGDDFETRYRIEGQLGQGGMGAVLLATDTRLDRKVAIKRILGEAAGNRMAVTRFLTEAKSIAALNHPNIVQIYDYGRAKDGPFLIMEFVDGGSLLDRCRESALPLDEAIDLACQLCDGLAKAHDLGIIHRDIKPANVLLTKDGTPKLTDFGLAKATASDHGQTMTGAVLGTPDFMPPEQRRDASEVDHRSDLWSLAATIYQMVTGRSPKIIRFDLLPSELTKILGIALEDDKDARYQTARKFRDALRTTVTMALKPITEFVAGQCSECGTVNDVVRKFCSTCGASLRVPCLACSTAVGTWEKICGECGGNQPELLVVNRAKLAQRQIEAEKLLEDLRFDMASGLIDDLGDLDSRFIEFRSWKEDYKLRLERSRESEEKRTDALVAEALQHEAAFDYLAAANALEKVPASLREPISVGFQESPAVILARVTQKQATAETLGKIIRQAIADRQLDDLLPKVSQLLGLCPNRIDVAKIKRQLEERQEQLERRAASILSQARAYIASGEKQQSLDLLDRSGLAKSHSGVAEFRASVAKAITSDTANKVSALEIQAQRVDSLHDTVNAALHQRRFGTARQAITLFLGSMKPESQEFAQAQQLLARCDQERAKAREKLGNETLVLVFGVMFAPALVSAGIDAILRMMGLERTALGWVPAVFLIVTAPGGLFVLLRHVRRANKKLDL